MEIGLLDTDREPSSLDEILNFQKSAIYRQCLEYKRLYSQEILKNSSLQDKIKGMEKTLARIFSLGNFTDLDGISNYKELQDACLKYCKSGMDFDDYSDQKARIMSLQRENEHLKGKNDLLFTENSRLHRKIDRSRLVQKEKEEEKEEDIPVNTEITDKKLLVEIQGLKEDLKIKQENLEKIQEEKKDLVLKLTENSTKELLSSKDSDKIVQLQSLVQELKLENNLSREKYKKSLEKIEELEGREKEFQGKIIKEEGEKRRKIIADFKAKEGDNARLRKERDTYKYKYDLKCVKDEDSRVNKELQVLINCQKVIYS